MTPSQNALRRGFYIFLSQGKTEIHGLIHRYFDPCRILVDGSISEDTPDKMSGGV